MSIKPYMKAVVGCLVAGLGTLATAMSDDAVSGTEWVGIAAAALAALSLVYGVPNKPPTTTDAETE